MARLFTTPQPIYSSYNLFVRLPWWLLGIPNTFITSLVFHDYFRFMGNQNYFLETIAREENDLSFSSDLSSSSL